jgi:predicted phage tail protein
MEPDDPPPKTYGFKEREFKRDNATGKADAPPTAKEMAIMAGPVVKSPKGATGPKAGDPNDVYTALQHNRAVEKQRGLNEIEIREIKSRRKRDYWLLIVGGNILIVGTVVVLGANAITAIFGLGGVILFNVGLTWVMWQVMDRY